MAKQEEMFPGLMHDEELKRAGRRLVDDMIHDREKLEKTIAELIKPDAPESMQKIGHAAQEELQRRDKAAAEELEQHAAETE